MRFSAQERSNINTLTNANTTIIIARAMSVFRECFDTGVIIRTTGDILAFSPPLIIDEKQIETVVETVRAALRK